MKKLVLGTLALCCCMTLFAARGKTTPHGWYDDYDAALRKAKEQDRPILVLFTGSDWCGFCVKLRKNALDKINFKSFASKHLILVYADNPKRTRLPQELLEQNRMLRKKLAGSSGGVPCTVIITPDEEELGSIRGCPRNPDDYLKRVREIVKSRPRGGARGDFRKPENNPPPRNDFRKPENDTPPRNDFRKPENDTPPRNDFRKPENNTTPRNDVRKPENDTPPRGDGRINRRNPLAQIVFPRLSFSDTDVGSALRQLEQRSKDYDPEYKGVEIRFDMTDRRTRRVTLNLTNAPLDEIIHRICARTGLGYRIDGRTIRVFDK